MFVMSPF